MRPLEELKSIDDGGSFYRLVKNMEEAANGDESLKLDLLTERVLGDFINIFFRKAMDRKLLVVKEKESNHGFEFVNLNFKIPRKIRSNVIEPHVSKVESNDKSMKICYCRVVDEEEIVKKQRKVDDCLEKLRKADDRLEKQRKADDCLEKKRKAHDCLEEKEKKKKRNIIKKNNLDDQLGFNPPPDLPQEFKDQIERMNGTNIMLVTQKELTSTDMDRYQNHFAVLRGRVRSHDFLTEEETLLLSQKGLDFGIKCSLIQPCFEEIIDLEFKRWDMNKTFSYILIKKWKSISYNTRNQLEISSKV